MDSNSPESGVSWAQRFYDEQIALLQAKRIDELIDSHYHLDATLVSFEKIVRGNRELKLHFRGYMERLGTLEIVSLNQFVETMDSLFFEATVVTNLGRVTVYDAFVVRDGKATHHFTGVK
jgi:hypothetical protein